MPRGDGTGPPGGGGPGSGRGIGRGSGGGGSEVGWEVTVPELALVAIVSAPVVGRDYLIK